MVDLSSSFAIGIPTFQGKSKLRRLLDSIAYAKQNIRSNYNIAFEIFVVVDGSTDGTLKMIENFKESQPELSMTVEFHGNRGRSYTRNRIIELCEADILWFLDDDTIVSSTALETHINFAHTKDSILIGPCLFEDENLQKWYSDRYETILDGSESDDSFYFSVANASARLNVWCLEYFNEAFKGHGFEDYDYGLRMLQHGVKLKYLDSAAVQHSDNLSKKDIFKRLKEGGDSLILFCNAHPEKLVWAFVDSNIEYSRRNSALASISYPVVAPFFEALGWMFYFLDKVSRSQRFAREANRFMLFAGISNRSGKQVVEHALSRLK